MAPDHDFLEKASYITRALVKDAGDRVLEGWRHEREVEYKDVRDVVTKYDRWVERTLIKQLRRNFPKHSFRGEETKPIKQHSDYEWFIDPIDGTKYFATDIPLFAVSVGLVFKREPVLGVIYNPISDQMYWGFKGGNGVYANYKKLNPKRFEEKERLIVYAEMANLKAIGSRSEIDWVSQKYLDLSQSFYRVRTFGCSSLALSWTCAGGLDCFIDLTGRINFYDIAGGLALVGASGGTYEEIDVGLTKKRLIAAPNKKILNWAKEILLKKKTRI